MPHACVYAIEC